MDQIEALSQYILTLHGIEFNTGGSTDDTGAVDENEEADQEEEEEDMDPTRDCIVLYYQYKDLTWYHLH